MRRSIRHERRDADHFNQEVRDHGAGFVLGEESVQVARVVDGHSIGVPDSCARGFVHGEFADRDTCGRWFEGKSGAGGDAIDKGDSPAWEDGGEVADFRFPPRDASRCQRRRTRVRRPCFSSVSERAAIVPRRVRRQGFG